MKTIILTLFLLFYCSLNAQSETYDSLKLELDQFNLTHSKNSEDKRVWDLLNNLYEENLQTNKGLSQETLNEYSAVKSSDSISNKSIFYLFDKYQEYITETVAYGKPSEVNIQLAIMKLLAAECVQVYNAIPPIVMIYMGEVLMGASMNQQAQDHFEAGIQYYPDSIPIQVYLVLLNEHQYKKEKKRLISKHSDHWMVKSYLLD